MNQIVDTTKQTSAEMSAQLQPIERSGNSYFSARMTSNCQRFHRASMMEQFKTTSLFWSKIPDSNFHVVLIFTHFQRSESHHFWSMWYLFAIFSRAFGAFSLYKYMVILKKSRAPSAPLFLEFPFRKLVQKPKNFRRLRRRRVVLILMNFLRFEFFWGVLRFGHFGHQFGQIFPGGAY